MQVALESAVGMASQKQRKPPVGVKVSIGHRAAVQTIEMIEQIAIAVGRAAQLVEKVGDDHLHVIGIQSRELHDLL